MAAGLATARYILSPGAYSVPRAVLRQRSCAAAAIPGTLPSTQVRGVHHVYGTLESNLRGSASAKPKRVDLPYVDQVRAEHLIKVRMHIGHQKRKMNKNMGSTIYGFRHNIAIFDINKTWQSLRAVFYGFAEMAQARSSFFLLAPNKQLPIAKIVDEMNKRYPFQGNRFTSMYMLGYADKKWNPGTFSNWKQTYALYESVQRKMKDRPDSAKLKRMARELRGISHVDLMGCIIPDFMMVLATDRIALHEADNASVPLVGMVDSNINPRPYLYPVFGNDDSLASLQFMLDLLARGVEEGRKKEHEAFATLMVQRLKERLTPEAATLKDIVSEDEEEQAEAIDYADEEDRKARQGHDEEKRLRAMRVAATYRKPGAAGKGVPVVPAGPRFE